uniref:Ig-like domain-containing protein n=1 Tax=Xiphophorus maculatus TaxID=8083 RepID=A0A3B5QQ47_XIPMA
MIVLLVTFLFLQWGHTLVPMNIVQTGESVTFKCPLPSEFNERDIYWYKQRPGDNLRLILKVSLRKQLTTTHKFEPEFNNSRWKVNNDQKFSNLTLLKATYSDEGFYHCVFDIHLTLTLKLFFYCVGNTVKMSDCTVIQQPAASNPVRPGDTATFQCSVLFEFETMACSEDFRMFWFQAKSNNTYPNMIYTDGNKHHECEKRSDSEKSCMFNFSKVVNSSDSGIFYCAVTSCGKILFGNGTRLEIGRILMFWFQAKSNNTYPNMIYTDGNKHHECEKRSDSEKSCMFNYSKVVNSSDSGIFYCAVTSCGKILFGNGTRLEIGRILSLIL